MERVLSVEEIPNPYWSSQSATSSANLGLIRQSSSEQLLKYFEGTEAVREAPNPNPIPNSGAVSAVSSIFSLDDEVVEIINPLPPANIPANIQDPEERRRMHLMWKLDMECQRARLARASGLQPQDPSLSETRSPTPDSSNMESQAPIPGTSSKVQLKAGGGSSASPVLSGVQNSGVPGMPANIGSSREQSDDDDLKGELGKITPGMDLEKAMDPEEARRIRRMQANKESAKRSRIRKQKFLTELEQEVSQLRVENSSLLKRLTDLNNKHTGAAVDNRVLKADVETLRAKVKMAEDGVKRTVLFPAMTSDMSSISMPLSASPSDATSDAVVLIHDDLNLFQSAPQGPPQNIGIPREFTPTTPLAEDAMHGAITGGKMGRTVSMQQVASLEHLPKRICGTPGGSCGPSQWEAAVWDL